MDKENFDYSDAIKFQIETINSVLKEYDMPLIEFTSNLIGIILEVFKKHNISFKEFNSYQNSSNTFYILVKIVAQVFEEENHPLYKKVYEE